LEGTPTPGEGAAAGPRRASEIVEELDEAPGRARGPAATTPAAVSPLGAAETPAGTAGFAWGA